MANFTLSTKPGDQWLGGPPAYCHICNFPNVANTKGYLIVEGLKVLMHDNIEVDLHLCIDEHAAALKGLLDTVLPDERLPKLQAQALAAEAARAKAEKRTDAAEKALYAMQDWQSAAKPGVK